MRVYRIEGSQGYGAYQICCLVVNDEYRHPDPTMDSKLSSVWFKLYHSGRYRDWFFGFKDMDQFRSWFYDDEWLKQLKRNNGKLTIWEVPDDCVHVGNAQVIFMRREATLIATRELI